MKKQTISRENLSDIYSKVCSEWQSKIDALLEEQKFSNDISVPEDLIMQAHNEADNTQEELIKKYFNIPESLIEGIKTFSDILNIAGLKESKFLPYPSAKTEREKSINAFAKIGLIEEVMNGGWKPNWKDTNEPKYYPYLEYKAPGGWVFYGGRYFISVSGGEPAYFKTREIAIHVGKTFTDIYNDLLDR